tara:strand:+ start:4541 stop:6289 length:1749 start_codon:yes stop_codon:yes gene_type:complete
MSNFPLQNAAEQLAKQGRYGDTMMVHMNPIEVDALAKLSPTGQLTINPQTGQPEAFLPLIGSLIAPTLLGSTALGAALSPLAASAIGTGLGTVAEGGSLKEGITAGLTGAITGGLLKGFMPGTATEIPSVGDTAATTDKLLQAPEFVEATGGSGMLPGATLNEAGQEALNVLQPGTTSVPFQPVNTLADLPAARAGTEGFFSRLGQNLGFSGGATPEQLAGNPNLMTQSQAFTTQALPAAASGLVGEMYVPMDFNMPEEEDPFGDYEGPYVPQEMRTMIPGSGGNPLASAFQGEQQLIQGNPLPIGDEFNFNDGGKVNNPFDFLPSMSGLALAGNMAESGAMGLLPMAINMFKDDEDEKDKEPTMKEKENQRQFIGTVPMDMMQGMDAMQVPTDMLNDGGMPLQNPEKADLDNDGELSSYERTRGKAIEENMKNMGGLIKMANGRTPAQAEIEESAETLERRRIDDAIRKQFQETMSAPMVDPRLGRMADPISTPVPRTLNDVMTPQPFQAPSLADIRRMQSASLDRMFVPTDPDNPIDRGMATFNRRFNPIVRGIEAISPVLTKGGLELYEAIDEFRKRDR